MESIHDTTAKITQPTARANYSTRAERFGIEPARIGSKPRKRSTQAQHEIEILKLLLSATNAPRCDDYLTALYIVRDEAGADGVLRITDRRLAYAIACGGNGRTHRQAIEATRRAIRAQRLALNRWQDSRDGDGLQNPLLAEYVREYKEGEKRNHSVYPSLPFIDLIKRVAAITKPTTSRKELKRAVLKVLGEYASEQNLRGWKKPKERKATPEAELSRGLALIAKACGLEAMRSGEAGAVRLLRDTLAKADKTKIDAAQICTFFAHAGFANLPISSNLTDSGCDKICHTLQAENSTAFESVDDDSESDFVTYKEKPYVTKSEVSAPVNSQTNLAHAVPPNTGNVFTITDFIVSNPAYHQPEPKRQDTEPTARQIHTLKLFRAYETDMTFAEASARISELRANNAEPFATPAQMAVLAKASVYDDSLTISQASARIAELIETGGFIPADWFSLAELQSFDTKTGGYNKTKRRFCCPSCGVDKTISSAHRSLCVDMQSGVYYCHRCQTAGVLREFCEGGGNHQPRSFPALSKPEPTADDIAADKRWRRWFANAKPIAGTDGARYLAGRGIQSDVAAVAGVRFGAWYRQNEAGTGAERFAAVIFPAINQFGELVSAQARSVADATKRTAASLQTGIFLSNPNALKTECLAVTEAPIDALALEAAGQPAIALNGTYAPEWLIDLLDGKRVLIAPDADGAGDDCAARLAELLAGRAEVIRLRPTGGKDFGEIIERYGIASIEAQIEFACGLAEPGAADEWEQAA